MCAAFFVLQNVCKYAVCSGKIWYVDKIERNFSGIRFFDDETNYFNFH